MATPCTRIPMAHCGIFNGSDQTCEDITMDREMSGVKGHTVSGPGLGWASAPVSVCVCVCVCLGLYTREEEAKNNCRVQTDCKNKSLSFDLIRK